MHLHHAILPLALLPTLVLSHDGEHHSEPHSASITVPAIFTPTPTQGDAHEDDCHEICKGYTEGTVEKCTPEWYKAIDACISAPCNIRFVQDPAVAAGCPKDEQGEPIFTIQTKTTTEDAGTTGVMSIPEGTETEEDAGTTGVMSIPEGTTPVTETTDAGNFTASPTERPTPSESDEVADWMGCSCWWLGDLCCVRIGKLRWLNESHGYFFVLFQLFSCIPLSIAFHTTSSSYN
jgi:hypothetical protein